MTTTCPVTTIIEEIRQAAEKADADAAPFRSAPRPTTASRHIIGVHNEYRALLDTLAAKLEAADFLGSAASREAYMALVIEYGKGRLKNFGDRFAEDDFICGALVAFEAAGHSGEMPASWAFGMLAGGGPITGPRPGPIEITCQLRGCTETEYVAKRTETPHDWVAIQHGTGEPIRFCSIEHLARRAARMAS